MVIRALAANAAKAKVRTAIPIKFPDSSCDLLQKKGQLIISFLAVPRKPGASVVFTGGHGPAGPGPGAASFKSVTARLRPSARRRSQSVTLTPTWRDWLGARPHRGRAAGSEGRNHDPTFEAPGPRRAGGPSRQSGPGHLEGWVM